MRDERSTPRSLVSRPKFRSVLSLVAAHMLETGRFADVPRTVVPVSLDAELTALLDEQLVLRHDLGPVSSLLAEPTELLNFTFDEMRDYRLAQHLLAVYAQDPEEFTRLVAAQQPATAQTIEGLQRFLFYASRAPAYRAFFESHREHQWYSAVYDAGVFAIPPSYLCAEDRLVVEKALEVGGERARHFAEKLAVLWRSAAYPVLNLDVLLAVARRAAPSFFTDVIVPVFGRSSYGKDSLVESLCSFVRREVLPTFRSDQDHPYGPLFRLLLLLLPIGANAMRESPTAAVFRELIAAHPACAVSLLEEAMRDGWSSHRTFLWRLLGPATRTIHDPASLIAAADADLASSDPALCQEAKWFLEYVGSGGSAS